jgi:hypothetical protein
MPEFIGDRASPVYDRTGHSAMLMAVMAIAVPYRANHSPICGARARALLRLSTEDEFCSSPAIYCTLIGVPPACTSRISATSSICFVQQPAASTATNT